MIEYENLALVNAPFANALKESFEKVLNKGWYILGQEVEGFEKSFAQYCGTNYCVGVANGLDALAIALKALQMPAGSEVIVPSNTYIATVLAVLQAGFKPILVEPDIATYNIDPLKIEEKITPQTRCILVVHLYGKMCNMGAVKAIADRHHLFIVEDAAQAHGASYKNVKAGNWGAANAFSFYPTKNLGALGDAGAVTCNNAKLAGFAKSYRNYGSSQKYHNELAGTNSRLHEVQAAFLNVKLPHLDRLNNHKRKLAQLYLQHLKEVFILPVTDVDYHDVYHIFAIRHPKRDALKNYLFNHGIKTEIHYPIAPVNQLAMKGILNNISTPIAALVHGTVLSLPISSCHTENDIYRVIETMNAF